MWRRWGRLDLRRSDQSAFLGLGVASAPSQLNLTHPYSYPRYRRGGHRGYVLDTGIQTNQPTSKAAPSWRNFVDRDSTDANGHGTHVAGTIGSKTYGVAKKAHLYGVKVMNGQGFGTTSGIIARH